MKAVEKSEFSKRLKSLLEERDESIYKISDILHLNPSTISRYKNGILTPKLIVIEKLAEYFSVNPVWLMGYDVDKVPEYGSTGVRMEHENKTAEEIIKLYANLPKGLQDYVLDKIMKINDKNII